MVFIEDPQSPGCETPPCTMVLQRNCALSCPRSESAKTGAAPYRPRIRKRTDLKYMTHIHIITFWMSVCTLICLLKGMSSGIDFGMPFRNGFGDYEGWGYRIQVQLNKQFNGPLNHWGKTPTHLQHPGIEDRSIGFLNPLCAGGVGVGDRNSSEVTNLTTFQRYRNMIQ